MTVHYHGLPITPNEALLSLPPCSFCVSHAHPYQVATAHQLGERVMMDNGAFSKFKSGKKTDWPAFYDSCEPWLQHPNTWAVIPDEINAGSQIQDALLKEWPHGEKGAPVWHTTEPIERLLKLLDEWPRVCIGAEGEYYQIPGDAFCERMDEAWEEITKRHRWTPNIHMLRGMQLTKLNRWPFASVDSTDVARNHHRAENTAPRMVKRWGAANITRVFCPSYKQGRLL